ncbi:MAG TPA: hypothetical protein VN519_00080 [Bryobacteraceae bacterium]|nr:hypothetical protein [Bryobacteraceae bacterium]
MFWSSIILTRRRRAIDSIFLPGALQTAIPLASSLRVIRIDEPIEMRKVPLRTRGDINEIWHARLRTPRRIREQGVVVFFCDIVKPLTDTFVRVGPGGNVEQVLPDRGILDDGRRFSPDGQNHGPFRLAELLYEIA